MGRGSYKIEAEALINILVAYVARRVEDMTEEPSWFSELGAQVGETLVHMTRAELVDLLSETFATMLKEHPLDKYAEVIANSSFQIWMEEL